MVPDTNTGRGPKHLLKSTPVRLSRLRTGQQEVNGTSSMKGGFAQCCPILCHNMAFSTWRCSSINKSFLLIEQTFSSLLPPAHHISMPTNIMQLRCGNPIVDKLARKRFFSRKTPTITDQAQKSLDILFWLSINQNPVLMMFCLFQCSNPFMKLNRKKEFFN